MVLLKMSKRGKHITYGHVQFVCQMMPPCIPSLILTPSLMQPHSVPLLSPSFAIPQGGELELESFKLHRGLRMKKPCLFRTLPLTDTAEALSVCFGDCLQSPLNDTAVSLCSCVKRLCQDCHRCTYFLLNCLVQSTLSYVFLASTGTQLCIVYSTCLVNAFKWKDLSEMPT